MLHHADHEIHRITVFCPSLYSFGVLRTWQDDQLFSVYPGTAPEARAEIAQALPRNLQTKYKWGIRPNSELPYGFVFLKRKKAVSKGTYPDIIFSVVLWNPDASYSTDN